ncbi:MAG: hypothetical protein QOF09_1000 [Alphaproteobacteria bacterium]|jgi:hypothetical protein|nr:hypothetical protein [Alphaproteobacteria bacterium]
MRFFMMAAILALLVQPALAQRPSVNLWGEKATDPRVEQYRKELEQEHKAALDKIPDQKKQNNDPWQSVRSPEHAKKKSN